MPPLSDGWFYEGAGIYRHVWLVKTNPLHVKQWGTLVTSQIRGGEASLSVRTEVNNDEQGRSERAIVSTILDPPARWLAKDATAPARRLPQGRAELRAEDRRGAAARCGRSKRETSTRWSPRFKPAAKSWIAMKLRSAFEP